MRTFHPDLLGRLERELKPFDLFINQDWFIRSSIYPMPRLSDFLTLERIEGILGNEPILLQRIYDEKFHILQAPTLIIPDINFYRERCALRGKPVVVAYLDIDNFKKFNEKYGETKIDRDLLPIFMKHVEGFVFARGHAYRHGGDEYVLVLPNMTQDAAVSELDALRNQVKGLNYRGIEEKTRISIGFCVANPDCFLTDRELEERAEHAKNYVKSNGRDFIATYSSPLFREEDLYRVPPPSVRTAR
jgi:diguanylate cyclase (GGDEF)-like protein